jgi:hypothetical protein
MSRAGGRSKLENPGGDRRVLADHAALGEDRLVRFTVPECADTVGGADRRPDVFDPSVAKTGPIRNAAKTCREPSWDDALVKHTEPCQGLGFESWSSLFTLDGRKVDQEGPSAELMLCTLYL